MRLPFYTVGHSTRALEEFTGLLRKAEVALIVDIRTVPKSRTNPQYNKDILPESLAARRIGYEHVAALGGLRARSHVTPSEVNGFWENSSFHNYADYALSDAFRAGFDRLLELGRAQRCAIMCSEAVWWRCHRRIVADYLIAHGEGVFHLMGEDRIEPARLTEGACVQSSRLVVYPLRRSSEGRA
jgi:uncharacterized protein (DUF488 family)